MTRSPIVALVGFIFFSQARGQETTSLAANPDSALQTILNTIAGTPLTLHDAVQSALSNATSVRTAEAAYMSAEGASRRENGSFEPELFFSFNRIVQDLPSASFFAGATVLSTAQNTASGGLHAVLPTGTSVDVMLNAISLSTNSAFVNLNPQYTTFGSLQVRQPLLRGFTVSGNKNAAKANRDLDAAKSRYDQATIAVGTEVEQNYWDLYAAERDYAVQRLTRDRAEAFLKDTQTRARSGLIGPNQVANAKTFLAEQEILLIDREEQFDRLSDAFASLIGKRPDEGKVRFITVDSPPGNFQISDLDVLLKQALDNNLALRAAKADVEAGRSLSDASSWEALPKLDLVGSIAANGLGGTGQNIIFNGDTLPPNNIGTYSQAINQVLRRDYPVWSLGLEFSFPLTLRKGLGEEERLEAMTVIAEQRQVEVARILDEEVRANYRELQNGERRLRAARDGVDAAQEQVRIGMVEFENGRTTAFELVRLGEDFAVAQQRYSQALVQGAKAAAALRELTSGAPIVAR